MARIAGVSPKTRNPLLRLAFWFARRRAGRAIEPVAGYARCPSVLAALAGLELGMARARRLDPSLKKLAELRVAALVGCAFCLDIGSKLVRDLGVPERKPRELNAHRASDAFSPLEKAVLDYADRMTATPVDVRDEDVRALLVHLDEPQLVELTAAIAHENLRGRMNHALGYGGEGLSAGGYCVRPAWREPERPGAAAALT